MQSTFKYGDIRKKILLAPDKKLQNVLERLPTLSRTWVTNFKNWYSVFRSPRICSTDLLYKGWAKKPDHL